MAAGSKRQANAFYIDSRLSAIKVPSKLDILMTDKQHRRQPMVQSDMYLENFTQIKISEEMNISKDYRPNKPIEINNESSMLFLIITSNKGKHKVITLYNL